MQAKITMEEIREKSDQQKEEGGRKDVRRGERNVLATLSLGQRKTK